MLPILLDYSVTYLPGRSRVGLSQALDEQPPGSCAGCKSHQHSRKNVARLLKKENSRQGSEGCENQSKENAPHTDIALVVVSSAHVEAGAHTEQAERWPRVRARAEWLPLSTRPSRS